MSPEPLVSVVVPARDAATTIGECLRAVDGQSLEADRRELLVVVDRRTVDSTARIAGEHGDVLIVDEPGAAAARNLGVAAARGEWIAFTDADCVPTRGWLRALLEQAEKAADAAGGPALGAAGPTTGLRSETAAARFVDLTGGLDAERHLAHPRYPWAPTTNVLYRREALLAVGGFDARFLTYEGCDLHTRLLRAVGGPFPFAARAVVFHHHRPTWRAYWRQQVNYGRGYAQFFLRYADELAWSPAGEAGAWLGVLGSGLSALVKGRREEGLVHRGTFVKSLAQRRGFLTTYWRPRAATRWRAPAAIGIQTAR